MPEHAWARVDVRVMNQAEAERLDASLRGLQPQMPGDEVEVTGGINRPPMVRTRGRRGAVPEGGGDRWRAGLLP